MSVSLKRVSVLTVAVMTTAGLAACSSSKSSTSATTAAPAATTAAPGSSAPTTAAGASISATSFTSDFSAMSQLTSLASQGKGLIGVLLPDTTTSTRYVAYDQPYLQKAFTTAGLSSSQFKIDNAQGSDDTMKTQADADITEGASVLIVDPNTPGGGAAIEADAASKGVKVIDYDRLTLGGSRSYYVSFNNVLVGKAMGQGLVSCISAWHVSKPQVVVMHGAATDNNATLFAQGYDGVLNPLFNGGKYTAVAHTAGTWDAPTQENEFQAVYTAHTNTNAALVPNDTTNAPIVTYLQSLHVKPKTFPTTGQDASLVGLQNVLAGYQCGSVYKPIFLETQAAAALAIYLRAGQTPPPALLNGKTSDTGPTPAIDVPSVLLTPVWVTTANMNSTVVADKFVDKAMLCAGAFAAICTSAGIS